MGEIRSYKLSPTRLIPNSPYPLIHYKDFFNDEKKGDPAAIHEVFRSNKWATQWIFRYGPTQPSHYHSATHECMAVLTGSATVRFGVADVQADDGSDAHGDGKEAGGVEVEANAGDVFVVPAGVAHKTFHPAPDSTFKLLTPGEGHGIAAQDAKKALADIKLSGFTMIGAFPEGGVWEFSKGGDHLGDFENIWKVPKPPLDPVMGAEGDGICGRW